MLDENVAFRGSGSGFGGDWAAILVLLALMGRGGFGFGGEANHSADIERMMLMQGEGVNQRFNALQSQMDFNANAAFQRDILGAIAGTNHNIDLSSCSTNRNIDGVHTSMVAGFGNVINANERNTAAIIQNQTNLAKDAELREAYATIARQGQELSEQRITSTILQNLQPPRPVPSYPVMSPYAQYVPTVRVDGHGCHGFN